METPNEASFIMNVLITGVGGPTPRSFAIALRNSKRYAGVKLIATDCSRYALGLYQKNLFNVSHLVPRSTMADYWDTITRLVAQEQIDCAVVLPEAEVLEWAKRALHGTLPCKVLIPEFGLVDQLVDKAVMTELLASSELVPKSSVLSGSDIITNKDLALPLLPFWIRSATGSSGLGSLKINTIDELRNWIAINHGVEKFLASEFLPGRNLCCKMLYFEGQLLRGAVGERVNYIMAKVAPSGITGNTSFGRLLNETTVFDIANQAMELLFEKTGTRKHGFFTVDLKEDEQGTPKVTEVNVRHVAFTQCFAAAGANFAEDTLRLLEGDPSFERKLKLYEFEPELVFMRDVDSLPILLKETDLLKIVNYL